MKWELKATQGGGNTLQTLSRHIQRIRAAGLHDSPPPEFFWEPVCGISVVKRKITPVFTEVISYLVDLKGIEPSNLTDANRALSQADLTPNFDKVHLKHKNNDG